MAPGMLGKLLVYVESLLQSPSSRSEPLFCCLADLYSHIIGYMEKLEIFVVKGQMRNSNSAATILSIGHRGAANELARVLCSRIETTGSGGKAFPWQIDPACSSGADLTWISARKQYMKRFENSGYFVLPIVTFSLDLRQSIDDLMKRMSGRRRKDIRKLHDCCYSYTVSRNNATDFDVFYWKMYIPYISSRFQDAASIMTCSKSWSFYNRKGGILFVRNGEKLISGILFQMKGRELYAVTIGIHSGSAALVRNFAGQAALLFLIEWAKAQGFTKLYYGGTTPFMKDGIYVYKKEWGMAIEDKFDDYYYALKIGCPAQRALTFLQQNPFLFLDKRKLKALVFIPHRINDAELSHIASEHYLEGLDSMVVVSCDKSAECTQNPDMPSPSLDGDLTRSLSEMNIALGKQGFIVTVHELDRKLAHRPTQESTYSKDPLTARLNNNSNFITRA